MMKKFNNSHIVPPGLAEFLNDHLDDIPEFDDIFPGMMEALAKLNVRTGAANADEGFAAWVYGFDTETGRFYVTADQPHYIRRGNKRTFFWNGKKFV